VSFGADRYDVDEVFVHPEWTEMGPADLALLRLEKDVTGIRPIEVYAGRREVGRTAILVGHGDTRTGEGGAWNPDGRIRGATSRVERADKEWLYFHFDRPPRATELEGAPGRGDSGGPAVLLLNGKPFVAGVSSGGTDGEFGPATYGAEDSFVRVTSYCRWIWSIMRGGGPNRQAK
jgi:hypothetical protein